jgi:hypothetical protein
MARWDNLRQATKFVRKVGYRLLPAATPCTNASESTSARKPITTVRRQRTALSRGARTQTARVSTKSATRLNASARFARERTESAGETKPDR